MHSNVASTFHLILLLGDTNVYTPTQFFWFCSLTEGVATCIGKKCFRVKHFTARNSMFSNRKPKSDVNQLVSICLICKTKCKEVLTIVKSNMLRLYIFLLWLINLCLGDS